LIFLGPGKLRNCHETFRNDQERPDMVNGDFSKNEILDEKIILFGKIPLTVIRARLKKQTLEESRYILPIQFIQF